MNIQYIIVIAMIMAAVGYAGANLRKRYRSLSPKSDCGDDCGCGAKK